MKRKLVFLCSVIMIFILVSVVLIQAVQKEDKKEADHLVVTSFYPVYLLTKNLTQGAGGIEVKNLTENHTGCLHDYTLTTKDMKLLEHADLLVLNGGGMEEFLEPLLIEQEVEHTIDTSEGIVLLEGVFHMHEYENEHEEEEHIHGTENAHIWLDIENYRIQLENIKNALCTFDSENAVVYEKNFQNYTEELFVLQEKREELKAQTAGKEVVIFHDAFAYLAQMLDMEVIHSLALDEDTSLSAGTLAHVMEEVQLHQIEYLFVEEAYKQTAELIAEETGAVVYCLNPITHGSGKLTDYVDSMMKNMEIIERKP